VFLPLSIEPFGTDLHSAPTSEFSCWYDNTGFCIVLAGLLLLVLSYSGPDYTTFFILLVSIDDRPFRHDNRSYNIDRDITAVPLVREDRLVIFCASAGLPSSDLVV
jgi:hypothetical protein